MLRQQELLNLLTGLSGHFEVTSTKDTRSVKSLRETLAGTLVYEDSSAVRSSSFSFENSDLFFADTIASDHLLHMKELVGQVTKEAKVAERRVFVREVPFRSAQVRGSVPLWANGAAVEKTLGPFRSKDGRKLWFDFYKI